MAPDKNLIRELTYDFRYNNPIGVSFYDFINQFGIHVTNNRYQIFDEGKYLLAVLKYGK